MSQTSTIGWTNATWPIVAGCAYESPGCSNCWAVRDSWRLAHNPHPKVRLAFEDVVKKQPDGKLVWSGVVRTIPQRLGWPSGWRLGRRVFVCSQSDLFHPLVPNEFIAATFRVMAAEHRHTFQVLTKHPARALEWFRWIEGGGRVGERLLSCLKEVAPGVRAEVNANGSWPLRNVWFGVTVEDRRRAEERVRILHQIPARVRWISAEPQLERLDMLPRLRWCTGDMGDAMDQRIDWLVCGGESAQTRANTRPFDIGWARALLQDCRATGTRFFMKQLGSNPVPWLQDDGKVELRLPAGRTSRYKWHEPEHWPADLRVQEFPT